VGTAPSGCVPSTNARVGTALVVAMLSVIAFIPPNALHRFGLRTARGRRLQLSIIFTRVGLALLGVALTLTLTVVARLIFSPPAAAAVVTMFGAATLLFWFVVPFTIRHEDEERHVVRG